MRFVERVMRVMTPINIGATLGLAARMLWSGWQVVTSHLSPTHRVAEVEALMALNHAGQPAPMHSAPGAVAHGASPPCHAPQGDAARLPGNWNGGDL